jgi:hypothetical protein
MPTPTQVGYPAYELTSDEIKFMVDIISRQPDFSPEKALENAVSTKCLSLIRYWIPLVGTVPDYLILKVLDEKWPSLAKELILVSKAITTSACSRMLVIALRNEYVDIVEMLVEKGATLEHVYYYMLDYTIEYGLLKSFQYLYPPESFTSAYINGENGFIARAKRFKQPAIVEYLKSHPSR